MFKEEEVDVQCLHGSVVVVLDTLLYDESPEINVKMFYYGKLSVRVWWWLSV